MSSPYTTMISNIWKYIKQNPNKLHMAICDVYKDTYPTVDSILNTLRTRGQIKFQTGTGYTAIGDEYMLPKEFEKWLKSQKQPKTETTTEEKQMENHPEPQPKINPLKRNDKELITNIYNFVFSNPDISRSDYINMLALSLGIPHQIIDHGISYLYSNGSIIYSGTSTTSLRVNPKFGTTIPSLESKEYILHSGYNFNIEPSTKETLMFNPNELPKQVPPGFYSTGPGPVVVNKAATSVNTSITITIEKEEDINKFNNLASTLTYELGFDLTPNQVISHLLHIYTNHQYHNQLINQRNNFNWQNQHNGQPPRFQAPPWPDKNGNVPCGYGLNSSTKQVVTSGKVDFVPDHTFPSHPVDDDNVNKFK